jgi:hypothetical protein
MFAAATWRVKLHERRTGKRLFTGKGRAWT